MIFDALFIMRWSLLRDCLSRLPYHTVMDDVRIL